MNNCPTCGASRTNHTRFDVSLTQSGHVRITLTIETTTGLSATITRNLEQTDFIRVIAPVVRGLSSHHKDGIGDLLPPETHQ